MATIVVRNIPELYMCFGLFIHISGWVITYEGCTLARYDFRGCKKCVDSRAIPLSRYNVQYYATIELLLYGSESVFIAAMATTYHLILQLIRLLMKRHKWIAHLGGGGGGGGETVYVRIALEKSQ